MFKKVLRGAGYAVGALTAVALLAAAGGYAASNRLLKRIYDIPHESVAIREDSASIERGRHLATAIGKCVECHGDNLAGKVFLDEPGLALVVAKNLTRGRGGVGDSLTPADIERAVRHGVGRDGRALLFMPSEDWWDLSDEDVASIVAYLRALPPVDNVLPKNAVRPVGRALLASNQVELAAEKVLRLRRGGREGHVASVPAGPTAAYGRYLANAGGCTGCHGPGLSGGRIPGAPPDFRAPANLTPEGIGRWSESDFRRALREGRRPDGTQLDPQMPWRLTRLMSDDEIQAVYAYLRTVPPKPFGGR
jgi:mono/diheme cytochrome c family protein